MLPGVTTKSRFPIFPVSVDTNGVSVSVCSKSVVWLLNSHVILGRGAPTDLQEMSALPPSAITTVEVLRDVVMASTVKLEFMTIQCSPFSPQIPSDLTLATSNS